MKWLSTWILLFLVSSCVTTSSQQMPPPQSQAEAAFQRAERAMQRGDYLDANARYNTVRAQFPYSQFATLAELRLADAFFEDEKFISAISQYRNFIKLHPNHEKALYANWRIAESFAGQMPKPFFLLPPTHERELASSRDAERELEFFLRKYPDTEYTVQARRKLAEVRRRLADHEMYVAQFYIKKDNFRASAMRLTYLLEKYSGVGLDAQALFLLGRSYLELGDVDKAQVALTDLIQNFGDDPLARQAQTYLARHGLQ